MVLCSQGEFYETDQAQAQQRALALAQEFGHPSVVTYHLAPVSFQVLLVSHRMLHVACCVSPVTCQ